MSTPSDNLPPIAVIADAHFHDIRSDYGCTGTHIDGQPAALRSWQDTRKSSRVFNESRDALLYTLNDIERRGIRHVVLLGDYTDDGQIEANRRLSSLLHRYKQKSGIAFYAIPGNHDFYGPFGKHQSTRFVTTPGETQLVTSDPDIAATESETSILTNNMYCEGSSIALGSMRDFGLFKQANYLHWETPFGQSDVPEDRMFEACSVDGSVMHRLMDASYLVEPFEGTWLLMIDANVFEPRNGRHDPTRKSSFFNSSDAGWNAVLRVKPFLIDWIKNVNNRAAKSGKRLLAFSHYPVIDPIDNQTMSESQLFDNNEMIRRTPHVIVAETLLGTGLRLHFSGHMHVNSTTQHKSVSHTLYNFSVPSLVAFPAGYKLIQATDKGDLIDTISIGAAPLNPHLINYYQAESQQLGETNEPALNTKNYGEFLYQRMRGRVRYHYLKHDWPDDIATAVDSTSAADLAFLMLAQTRTSSVLTLYARPEYATPGLLAELTDIAAKYELTPNDFEDRSMMTLIADWYCLRHGGKMAHHYIGARNLRLYRCLAESIGKSTISAAGSHAAFFNVLINDFGRTTHDDQADIAQLAI